MTRRLIIDTDGGIDDAVAIWWAASDPRIDLVGVTTVGGVVSAEDAARNVLLVLEAAGRPDVPVAIGANDRLGPSPELRPADFIHGSDGLGNTVRGRVPAGTPLHGAIPLLDRLIDGMTSIVSLGPLTNLARLALELPRQAAAVDQLVIMGGAAAGGGNALPDGEANIAHDPSAAAVVVGAGWANPPLMIGLDVTHAATLDDSDFALLAEKRTPAAAFLDAPLRFYRPFGATFTAPACPCHDFATVLAFIESSFVTDAPILPLAIATAPGPAWGSTIVDFRAPAFARSGGSEQASPDGFADWRIGLGVDRALFRRRARQLFGD
ncbi:MAG: nucleoside hydrolase [Devosia sp.]